MFQVITDDLDFQEEVNTLSVKEHLQCIQVIERLMFHIEKLKPQATTSLHKERAKILTSMLTMHRKGLYEKFSSQH